MVGDPRRVDAPGGGFSVVHGPGRGPQPRVPREAGDEPGRGGQHVLGDVARPGAGVGGELGLVEALRAGQRFAGRQPVAPVGLALQGGQVVEQQGVLPPRAPLAIGHRGGRPRECARGGLRGGAGVEPRRRPEGDPRAPAVESRLHPVVVPSLEVAAHDVAAADEGQGGCLHPPEGVAAEAGRDGQRPGGVHAHQPVGLAARPGRRREAVVVVPVPEVGHPLGDRAVGERGDPQPPEGLIAPQELVDVAEDELTLAPRVGGHDQGVRPLEAGPDDVELAPVAVIGYPGTGLRVPGVPDPQAEGIRDYGQILGPPPHCVPVGLRGFQLHQMPERVGDQVAVALQVAVPPPIRPHDPRDVPRHGGLLRDDAFHVD